MKKFLIILCAVFFLSADVVWAQTRYPVFSSALGGGSGYYARRGVRQSFYRPRGATRYVASDTRPRIHEKTILKYAPNQIDLENDQMEKLMPAIRRIQDGKARSIELVGICRNYATASNRLTNLTRILTSYSPNLNVKHRYIAGPAVVDSNDNTIEFIEYW